MSDTLTRPTTADRQPAATAAAPAPGTDDAADPRPDPTTVVVRAGRVEDEAELRRIFRSTVLRGRPVPIDAGDLDRLTSRCLDWYLEAGEVRVVDQGGRIVGYLLACLDEDAHRRWVRRRAVTWAVTATGEVLTGRRRAAARRLVRPRLIDDLAAASRGDSPAPAHAHVALDPGSRGRGLGRLLLRTLDDLVRDAGFCAWYGETNVPAGRGLASVLGGDAEVVARHPNRTFSWLLGTPVERVTIVRRLRSSTAEGVRA